MTRLGRNFLIKRKGADHAMDHFCNSLDFVVIRIRQRLYDWRIHSYPPGDRHRRGTDSNYPGPKTTIVIWIL